MPSKFYTLLLFLGVLACSTFINAQSRIAFNQVLSHLGNFQTPNGGFKNAEGVETADATSSGLLLSSLYGLNAKINTVDATKFLTSLENKDGGYGRTPGAASDIESTRNALAGLVRLSAKAASADKTASYLKSQYSNGLFGGSLRSTALALQAYELLGQKVPGDIVSGVNAALKKEPATFSETVSEIYYGVLAASITGYTVAADKITTALVALQSPQGLFYTSTSKTSTSITSTADALLALYLLKATDSVNTATLRSALRYVPADIESAADAHVALAVTKSFRDNFVITTGAPGQVIIEGSKVRPAISISAKESGGVAHGGFAIDSKHTFHGKDASSGKLTWNQEAQTYSGEDLASAGNFGPFQSLYTLSTLLPGVGPIGFDYSDTKHVGYGIVVNPKATISLTGRDVKENEQVAAGTDFNFAVALSSSSNAKLLSGDFVVTLSVLDSSNVVIHQSSVDGVSNKEPVTFTYTLASADIPAGKLSFVFEVSSKSSGVHTTRTVTYNFAVAMVASNINFDQRSSTFKIGDTVKLSMEPATFADLRTPQLLSAKSAKAGTDAAATRQFLLDVKSPQGIVLHTVKGEAAGSSRYTFSVPVPAHFSSIGVNALTFRYKPASGEDIHLQNFDSSVNELYEDVNVLNYTVKADLELVDSSKNSASEYFYGDSVDYKFRVKDTVSGKYVTGSDDSSANVYLELRSQEKSTLSSVHVPAVAKGEQLSVGWIINPNAQSGKGALTLSVSDSDGKKINLKNTISQTVNIGGELTIQPHTLSTSPLDTTNTAFVVELGLYCRGKPLKDAQLHASVVYTQGDKEEVLATLPVAHSGENYSVSWAYPHREARSGTYKVNFFREVDRQLALEKRDFAEKEARKARQLKGEVEHSGSPLADITVTPIFSVSVTHAAPRFTQLPVKAEFAALIIFGGIVVWLINKRSNLK